MSISIEEKNKLIPGYSTEIDYESIKLKPRMSNNMTMPVGKYIHTNGDLSMKVKVFMKNEYGDKFSGFIDYYKLRQGYMDNSDDSRIKPYCGNLYNKGGYLLNTLKQFLPCDFEYFEIYSVIFDKDIQEYKIKEKLYTHYRNNKIKMEYENNIISPKDALKESENIEKRRMEKMREYIRG